LVDICGYELPINLQNFMQNDLTEVKIFEKVLGGYFFSETPCSPRQFHEQRFHEQRLTWLFIEVAHGVQQNVLLLIRLQYDCIDITC